MKFGTSIISVGYQCKHSCHSCQFTENVKIVIIYSNFLWVNIRPNWAEYSVRFGLDVQLFGFGRIVKSAFRCITTRLVGRRCSSAEVYVTVCFCQQVSLTKPNSMLYPEVDRVNRPSRPKFCQVEPTEKSTTRSTLDQVFNIFMF